LLQQSGPGAEYGKPLERTATGFLESRGAICARASLHGVLVVAFEDFSNVCGRRLNGFG
jgi:hypothetical protein